MGAVAVAVRGKSGRHPLPDQVKFWIWSFFFSRVHRYCESTFNMNWVLRTEAESIDSNSRKNGLFSQPPERHISNPTEKLFSRWTESFQTGPGTLYSVRTRNIISLSLHPILLLAPRYRRSGALRRDACDWLSNHAQIDMISQQHYPLLFDWDDLPVCVDFSEGWSWLGSEFRPRMAPLEDWVILKPVVGMLESHSSGLYCFVYSQNICPSAFFFSKTSCINFSCSSGKPVTRSMMHCP